MQPDPTEKQLGFSFFDQQPQPAFWMTPVRDAAGDIVDFEYRYCNQEFYRFTCQRPETVIGKYISDSPIITDPFFRKQLFKELLEAYTSGHLPLTRLYNPDIQRYYSYTRNRVEEGVLTVLQDRTEEYRMMQELEEQKNLMDNILQHSSNGISVGEMIRDGEGRIMDIRTLLANDAAVRYTGIPHQRYLAQTGGELDPGFTGSDYFKQCVHCMETGEPVLAQYYLEAVGRWMEVSISRMDANRQIYIFTDVTSIKNTQLALERSAKQLHTIINRTQSGIFTGAPIKDDDGRLTDFRFVLVNNALAAYLNQKPEDLVGAPGSQWFKGYQTNGLFEVFRDTYENDRPNRFDFHYHADGIDAWIDIMCTRFEHEILVTFTDYTPVKKLQLEMEHLVQELKRSNAHLEEFAHAASHDLKEPIRKVHTFSNRLRLQLQDRLNKAEIDMFDRMDRATERMTLLIEDLLQYSQVSVLPFELEEVDLGERIQQVLSDLELPIEEQDAQVQVDPMPVVRGHGRQLQQLFQNLLSNALKYSRPGVAPHVSVTASLVSGNVLPGTLTEEQRARSYHLLQVHDNGIGFEQQYAERIFQMFQRLHGRNEYQGTGVGLSIVRKVAENHGGFVFAEGSPGGGAVFSLYLPFSE